MLDFHTADSAEVPHVVVYDAETEEVVATFIIGAALSMEQAENAAMALVATTNAREG